MDELAASARQEPLAFRLAHLKPGRLRDVLEAAAQRAGWSAKQPIEGNGWGIACGEDKNSVVATVAEIALRDQAPGYRIERIVTAFECGKIVNPHNLRQQVSGAIVQGLGPILHEAIEFKEGRITNPSLTQYRVPRFEDLPQIEIELLDRPELEPVGAGETPLIALAPAVANALHAATGQPVRALPIRPAAQANATA